MALDLSGKYFVRRSTSEAWKDVTSFDGVRVLAIDGFNEQGDALNVYNEQWVNSQVEDVMVTTQVNGADVIIRKNVDLTLTFVAGERYAANPLTASTRDIYDNFVDYMTKHGAIYIQSRYTGKVAHVICLKGFKPTSQRLQRGQRSYILASIPFHCLEEPQAQS